MKKAASALVLVLAVLAASGRVLAQSSIVGQIAGPQAASDKLNFGLKFGLSCSQLRGLGYGDRLGGFHFGILAYIRLSKKLSLSPEPTLFSRKGAAAGGTTEPNVAVLLGGVMMARPARSLDEPVTKTTGGIVVLPAAHPLARRHAATPAQVERIGRAACDQCRFCTELCPRYLVGHPIEPHRAMQALGFVGEKSPMIAGTLYCCECNLCTLYSCPEDLDPKGVCAAAKPVAREKGLFFAGRPEDVKAHPLASARRVPTRRLMAKLGLAGFRNVGPLEDRSLAPRRVGSRSSSTRGRRPRRWSSRASAWGRATWWRRRRWARSARVSTPASRARCGAWTAPS